MMEPSPPAVSISGIGLATPLGLTLEENVERCRSASTAIADHPTPEGLTGIDGFRCARVPTFDIASRLKFPKMARFLIRSVECAVQSAYSAVDACGIEWASLDPERIALFTASGQTNLEYSKFFKALELVWDTEEKMGRFEHLTRREARLVDRYFSLSTLSNGGLAILSMELGAKGSSSNHTHSDPTFALAMRAALDELAADRCRIALVCGYDSLLVPGNILAYRTAGILAEEYRPFDRDARGLVLGEAGVTLVLERTADLQARGGTAYGEILGVGAAQDITHTFGPGWSSESMHGAIAGCGLAPRDASFLIAHGLGLPAADRAELECLRTVAPPGMPVTALKGATGYLGAATSGVELALGLLCARDGFVPPVCGLAAAPEAGVALTSGGEVALETPAASFISLSRSWGGQVAAVGVRAS